MIKELRYGGQTANPSDYDAPDGDLDLSVNIINEKGALQPLFEPDQFLFLGHSGYYDSHADAKVLMIHRVSGQLNYIVILDNVDEISFFWFKNYKNDSGYTYDNEAALIATFQAPFAVKTTAIIGNTICLGANDGLHYFLWKDNCYQPLPSKPPLIPVSFEITHNTTSGASTLGGDGVPTDTDDFSNHVFGVINRAARYENEHGRFTQPFFVRYALKLYDGSYIFHSAPTLMLFDVRVPNIYVSHDHTKTYEAFGGGVLRYKILDFDQTAFAQWEGLVSGIDIFVTAPIYTYDQSGKILKDVTGELHQQFVPERNKAIDLPDGIAGVDCHGEAIVDSNPDAVRYWNIPINDNFADDLENAGTFYLLRSIDFDKIKPDGFRNVNVKEVVDGLSTSLVDPLKSSISVVPETIVTRPALPDDYNSRHTVVPSSLFAYNNRLNMANLEIIPPKPLIPLEGTNSSNPSNKIEVLVYLRNSGTLLSAVERFERHYQGAATSPGKWELLFPYIYYPDAGAYKIRITVTSLHHTNKGAVLFDKEFPLTSHPSLNGAYWWIGKSYLQSENNSPDWSLAKSVFYGNKIYTSQVNNPFFFPLNGMNTIGTGDIIGVSAPVKALSQGQFGQFPLYAFTTDGVWALEVSENGLFSARQPVNRDVCINPQAITQIDSAVLYPTTKGICMLSGSQSQVITDNISSEKSDNGLLSMPLLLDTLKKQHYWVSESIGSLIFNEDFLRSCGMVYDYKNKRIYVYQPKGLVNGSDYAFVFSLLSQRWGMAHIECGIDYPLNSYPDTFAVSWNHVIDFSQNAVDISYGIFVTRPIKLDNPDMLKTVDTVIQRGQFPSGAVKQLLYGSRDLCSWHLVYSSRDRYLRGFRGTPYKYFRLAVICDLRPGESVSGATVSYTPRLTGQTR